MYRLIDYIFRVCLIGTCLICFGCGHFGDADDRLNLAESLIEECPDSALYILGGIDDSELREESIKARYALLKSMALDKSYIDTTTFDVLQPAIDYYLKTGNADDRLRTLYYKGRIHRNAGNDDLAMLSYMDALELRWQITDTLTLARLLVAQGVLLYKQYRIKEFVENNIRAGELYGKMGKTVLALRSYSRALDGTIRMLDKRRADSLANCCRILINESPVVDEQINQSLFAYKLNFGNIDDIMDAICNIQGDGMGFNLAKAYSRIGESELALSYIDSINIAPYDTIDSISYWAIKAEILESIGRDKDALESYRNYTGLLEDYHVQLFSNELLFSEKKHEMEIENMAQVHKRDNIIKWILATTVLLVLVGLLIYYRYRMNKAARKLAEGNAERLRLETEKLQLERDRLQLEAENLRLEAGQLEDERDRLESLLSRHETLSEEARQVIRERVSMLNGLFAQALTQEESYGKEFRKYVGKIKKDKKRFQESIGKAMEATHPVFMAYLREHGLTEREIDYVCLYAIGLRGKEIGGYLDLARHYNISSDIRRKLGLDSNGKNLGPFIREMMGNE